MNFDCVHTAWWNLTCVYTYGSIAQINMSNTPTNFFPFHLFHAALCVPHPRQPSVSFSDKQSPLGSCRPSFYSPSWSNYVKELSKLTVSNSSPLIFCLDYFHHDFIPINPLETPKVTNGFHVVDSNGSFSVSIQLPSSYESWCFPPFGTLSSCGFWDIMLTLFSHHASCCLLLDLLIFELLQEVLYSFLFSIS